jgi:hypothetical protein
MFIEFAKAFGILERKLSIKVYVCVLYGNILQINARIVKSHSTNLFTERKKVQDRGTIRYKQVRIKTLHPCIILQAIDKFYDAHKRRSNNGDYGHVGQKFIEAVTGNA